MKIRIQFVSNSSSTSYIFAMDEFLFKKCPTCGLTPSNPLSLLQSIHNGDTEVHWTDIDQKIEDLKEELARRASYITPALWLEEELENLLKYKEENKDNKIIFSAEVDYHDDSMNQIIRQFITQGLLQVLESTE